ncbi:vegetative incompatibility protein HET-E-1, putative [Rhizoctonia solani AG-3 Rhs1AP]|uniref:Vegetative incompatibility protein HET-E-1, putative n=2 Tax=Rhizoctonia solani AG-3 TaxID=1086053 RepID=X8JHC0_9AGAM|nr:vegetative incompatibility protein HET-E-1, putative [Rhizoctonia solani AG-3 Rhs1AP]
MTYPITSAAVSSDAKHIATGTKSGSVCVRDLSNGNVVVVNGPLCNNTSRVVSVGISPNGQLVGWGDCDSRVLVWNIHNQVIAGPFLGHNSEVNCIVFTPDNTRIISSSDSLIYIHDVRSGKAILTLDQKRPSLRQFGLSQDGTRIATGSTDGSINVWDSEKGYKVLGPLRGQSKPTISIAYSPDGTRIISASEANTICVWDTQNGNLLVGPFGERDRSPTIIVFSTDGTRIVSGFLDGTVFIWEAQTGDVVVGPIEGHRKPVTMVSFLSDNSQVISHSHDGALRIHDVRKVSIPRPF